METRHDGHIAALRAAAQPGRKAPPEFGTYLEKVRLHAYKVVARDVDELKAAGTTGMVGPNLDEQLASDAEEAGEPLAEFTRESIVEPGAFVAEGFSDGVMPTGLGDQLSDQEVDALVGFIVQSVGG